MSEPYKFGRLRGDICIRFIDAAGKKRRYTLGTSDPAEAKRIAPALYAELTRPKGSTVEEIWEAYRMAYAGRQVATNLGYTWPALRSRFARMEATTITEADCDAHIVERKEAGILPGTLNTELARLRMVLKWAHKKNLIPELPYIKVPPAPKRSERRLTVAQVKHLLDCFEAPHGLLYAKLIYDTAARTTALLELKWKRCDFDTGLIDLRSPELEAAGIPHKGRAIVPMTRMVRTALLEAQEGALSEYVIEYGDRRVKSCRRALNNAARRAGLGKVNPHLLRHSKATHMAEKGVSMEEIAQFLGHDDVETTRRIYARYSPNYLRDASETLEESA